MSRRIGGLLLILVAVVVAPGSSCATPGGKAGRPNFIIIFADDLGYGDLGCYGHEKFKTPNLDRMAAEGFRSTAFYSACPYCAPSRASIMTGRYPFRSGIVWNPCPDAGIDHIGMPDSEVTLAEALKAAGYATCCVGKWHLGHQPQFYPRKHGFDEYLGILYSNDMRPVELIENEKVVEYPVYQPTLTKRYTAKSIDFIKRNRNRPFFLYLPHAMPHKPLAASEEYYKKSGSGLYGDVISEVDWSVGEILKTLKELGIDDRTFVVFTSDNGPWYGGSTGGLKGMKGRSWEGGIRVPMIARWPGKIPAGKTGGEVCGTVDLMPTFLKAAGLPLPEGVVYDGRDIMDLVASGGRSPHTEGLFAHGGGQLKCIRVGKWKLHARHPGRLKWMKDDWVDPRAPDGVTIIAPYEQARPTEYPGSLKGPEGREMMLFDLEADPAETRDVAAEHPEVVKRLKGLFDKMDAQVPPPPPRVLKK